MCTTGKTQNCIRKLYSGEHCPRFPIDLLAIYEHEFTPVYTYYRLIAAQNICFLFFTSGCFCSRFMHWLSIDILCIEFVTFSALQQSAERWRGLGNDAGLHNFELHAFRAAFQMVSYYCIEVRFVFLDSNFSSWMDVSYSILGIFIFPHSLGSC